MLVKKIILETLKLPRSNEINDSQLRNIFSTEVAIKVFFKLKVTFLKLVHPENIDLSSKFRLKAILERSTEVKFVHSLNKFWKQKPGIYSSKSEKNIEINFLLL
jgi:hypothetical protein